jgi:hypothetical protein
MNWIDDRIKQTEDERSKRRKISDEASNTFDALWSVIRANIDYAKEKGVADINVFGNASTRDFKLMVPNSTGGKELRIRLSPDKQAILTGKKSFALDVCPSAVCFKDENGNEIELEKAAEMILGPHLFPSFYK